MYGDPGKFFKACETGKGCVLAPSGLSIWSMVRPVTETRQTFQTFGVKTGHENEVILGQHKDTFSTVSDVGQ